MPDTVNLWSDIYVHDAVTGTTTRASVSGAGEEGNFNSDNPSISADGRYVAFESGAWNLVPGDTNAAPDVFVRDMLAGTTTMVSVDEAGRGGTSTSEYPVISADGRHVLFGSSARNLVPDDTNVLRDVFVRDLVAGTTTRVNVSSGGQQALNGYARWDRSRVVAGRYVVFESSATNLVADDTNGELDVFVRDIVDGTTGRVNVSGDGAQADGRTYEGSASTTGDGRYVVFESEASNLVDGDTDALPDVFRRDLVEGITTSVDLVDDAAGEGVYAYRAQVGPDGRHLAFSVVGRAPVFLRDLTTGVTTVVAVSTTGSPGNYFTGDVAFSPDGRFIAFDSGSSDLVDGDTNDERDVFVRGLS